MKKRQNKDPPQTGSFSSPLARKKKKRFFIELLFSMPHLEFVTWANVGTKPKNKEEESK